jgi:Glucose / Sorbosone dehydrogenase
MHTTHDSLQQLSKFCPSASGYNEQFLLDIPRSAGANYHNGAWIGFEPNDIAAHSATANLYMSTGDQLRKELVPDVNTPYGKMLRMRVGAGGLLSNPADNPFYNPVRSPIQLHACSH